MTASSQYPSGAAGRRRGGKGGATWGFERPGRCDRRADHGDGSIERRVQGLQGLELCNALFCREAKKRLPNVDVITQSGLYPASDCAGTTGGQLLRRDGLRVLRGLGLRGTKRRPSRRAFGLRRRSHDVGARAHVPAETPPRRHFSVCHGAEINQVLQTPEIPTLHRPSTAGRLRGGDDGLYRPRAKWRSRRGSAPVAGARKQPPLRAGRYTVVPKSPHGRPPPRAPRPAA